MSPTSNMKILCTFPGRNGDLLWALPTIRAISQHFNVPVDLQISGEFTGIVPLLERQPYLKKVWADQGWSLTPPDEWIAPATGLPYDRVFNCGYRGWPAKCLPYWAELGVKTSYLELAELQVDYATAWISLGQTPTLDKLLMPLGYTVVAGWSDEWFELKFGVMRLLPPRFNPCIVCPPGSRWDTEGHGMAIFPTDWVKAAWRIWNGEIFLGCCSALHVLATAMGKPVVVLEPSTARHNPIFYPFGMDGRIRVVKGNDGQPTHDVRHTIATIEQVLHAR